MAGIYIHIPFCKCKCHYCNFFSVASLSGKQGMLAAIEDEIRWRRNYLAGEEVKTIYFGGGTPSLLSSDEINNLLYNVIRNFEVANDAEITLEANPDDLSTEKLTEFRQTGINRLSIGIQSFFEEDLEYLNRVHNSSQAVESVKLAQAAGFKNITIDLIYGIPTLSDEHWISNILKATSLGVQHISAYSLTVEARTPLEWMIRKGKTKPVDEEQSIRHFELLSKLMTETGFIHYEISNFCKEGWYSRHNSNYWNGRKYLGIGPSAHSFNRIARQWNVSGITPYIAGMKNGTASSGEEILTTVQHYNEYVMTSLRTMWGCHADEISKRFGEKYNVYFRKLAEQHINKEHLILKDNVFTLSAKGILMADAISSDLFVMESL
ncbi:MAG: radical SAM family heme chaperone HemW [Bacteroidales bacterium]